MTDPPRARRGRVSARIGGPGEFEDKPIPRPYRPSSYEARCPHGRRPCGYLLGWATTDGFYLPRSGAMVATPVTVQCARCRQSVLVS